jgi:DNA repair protein RAD16
LFEAVANIPLQPEIASPSTNTSTPNTRSARSSTRKLTRSFVKNSSDIEQEDPAATIESDRERSGSFPRRLLHVAVPSKMTSKSTPGRPHRANAATSATSRSSFASSTRDNSVGVDTPLTSVVTTPAEGSLMGRGSFNLSGLSLNASNKRKRGSRLARNTESEIDMSMDAQLARRLQEEEYGAIAESGAGPSGPGGANMFGGDSDTLSVGQSQSYHQHC